MLLGVDIGSSGVKAALVDGESGVLGSRQAQVGMFSPQPGWAEADPDQWWRAVCGVIPQLLAESGIDATEVDAVACSGMVPAVLSLDAAGPPLPPAIPQEQAPPTPEPQE